MGSSELRFNCPTISRCLGVQKAVLVDGKQRLESVRKFLRDELEVFDGHRFSDFTDRLPLEARFHVRVNDLQADAEVLQWYLDINSGGVAHTDEEIEKVRKMLEELK